MTAGGKRKGAGRKPLGAADRPEAVTIRAHPLAVARFKAWCVASALSHREAFEKLIADNQAAEGNLSELKLRVLQLESALASARRALVSAEVDAKVARLRGGN
jgi:hypothetical protein